MNGSNGLVTADEAPRSVRKPGRPPQTDEEARRAREHILTATSEVFGEFGYHGVSVARIIDVAQIARPTFYRYFRNADEALQRVLLRMGRSIGIAVTEAVAQVDGDIPKLVAGIEAYVQWAGRNRTLLRSIYAGGHDPTSPVFPFRPRLVSRLTGLVNEQLLAGGRAPLDEWTLDVFINSMEYACFRLYLQSDLTDEKINAARATILRTALALLGRADDWRRVLDTPVVNRQLFIGR